MILFTQLLPSLTKTADVLAVSVPRRAAAGYKIGPVYHGSGFGGNQGNPIPLEKRFDSSNPDIRY